MSDFEVRRVRKKAKSRKGLDKKFVCDAAGCNRSFTRLEHLSRHQLNHDPKQVFHCHIAGCPKAFVRRDLYNRHVERHARLGQIGILNDDGTDSAKSGDDIGNGVDNDNPARNGTTTALTSDVITPSWELQLEATPRDSTITTAANQPTSRNSNVGISSSSPMNIDSSTPHIWQQSLTPLAASGVVATSVTTGSNINGNLNGNVNSGSVTTINGHNFTNELHQNLETNEQNGELLHHHSHHHPHPHPSHHINPHSHAHSPTNIPHPQTHSQPHNHHHEQQQQQEDSNQEPMDPSEISPNLDITDWLLIPGLWSGSAVQPYSFLLSPLRDFTQISSPPSFVQSMVISESKRLEMLKEIPQLETYPEFSLNDITRYSELYWENFHFQCPILHRPSFQVDDTPAPLLLSIILIGASYAQTSEEFKCAIATPLRWVIFSSPNFHPPARVWFLQSLLLLEIYEKTRSGSRLLHERAHIHHGTTLQLIRRGSTLLDPSIMLPSHQAVDHTTWRTWVEAESIKRAVFLAFILDVSHCVLFGHGQLLHPNELQLSLPCDDRVWDSADDQRQLLNKPTTPFLKGLKGLLRGQHMEINSELGRLALLYGLLSHFIQMSSLDLESSALDATFTTTFRDKWESVLSKAIDFWWEDYDRSNGVSHSVNDSNRNQHDVDGVVFNNNNDNDDDDENDDNDGDSSNTNDDNENDNDNDDNNPYEDNYIHKNDQQNDDRNNVKDNNGSNNQLIDDNNSNNQISEHNRGDVDDDDINNTTTIVLHQLNKPDYIQHYHYAYISMRVKRYELHVFCGDRRVLGKTTIREDYLSSEKYMYEWCKTAEAREAAFHALKALCTTFMKGNKGSFPSIYSVVDDPFIHRPMIIAHCTLVFWAYAFCLHGPESDILADKNSPYLGNLKMSKEQEWALAAESGRTFLERGNKITKPSELDRFENQNQTVGLLKWVILALNGSNWPLIVEICQMMDNCVKRSLGWEDVVDNELESRDIQVG